MSSLVGIAAASFSAWAATHGKSYATREELQLRRSIYAANVAKIEKHNAEAAAGLHTWTQGVNAFSDLTADEFKATRTGRVHIKERKHVDESLLRESALPDSVDWTTKGAVTPIKDQGQCGSCWAFSVTGTIEGAVFIASGRLTSLSEQQLVDCATPEGTEGCNGGWEDEAMQYVIDNKGLGSEASYPYTAKDGKCQVVPSVSSIKSFTDVPANSDTALMTAVVQQPVSVTIEADQAVFQSYKSGVMTGKCGTNLDHAVLAVGYGTDAGKDYYKIKNSWGAAWGEQGFIRLGRGPAFGTSGQCGILSVSSYANA